MRYTVVSSPSEIKEAMRIIELILKKDTQVFDRYLGNQKNRQMHKVLWNERVKLWYVVYHGEPDKYWCSYGLENPTKLKSLDITVQINPYRIITEKTKKNMSGILVKDADGRIFLAHTGKVGGGKIGIGKIAFLRYYTSNHELQKVMWLDGKVTKVIIVSGIDDEHLSENIAKHVKIVADFKKSV